MDSTARIRLRPRLAVFLGLAAIVWSTGCVSTGGESARAESAQSSKKAGAEGQRKMTIEELDQLIYAYADRYFMAISSAAGEIVNGNSDPVQRRIAHQVELHGVVSMNNIVSGDDPYSKVFELVSTVTLESRLLIDENRAEEVFGKRAPPLIDAIRTMRVEAWDLAAKVLTQDQLERLDYVILEWRRTHPGAAEVAYAKFDEFAEVHATDLLAELKAGGGSLAPFHKVTRELGDARRLTERIFWYSQRAPNVLAIQAQSTADELLSAPEIVSTLQISERMADFVESTPALIAAERQAITAELDKRQGFITNALAEARPIVTDGNSLVHTLPLVATNVQQLVASLQSTLQVADEVRHNFGFNEPSEHPSAHPFDVREYTTAFTRLNEAVTNLQTLSLSADQISASTGWEKALHDLSDAADRRVNRIFAMLCLLLGMAFVLGVLYRVIVFRLTARPQPSPSQKS
jgi:hypothetical protein